MSYCDYAIDGADAIDRDWLFRFCTDWQARAALAQSEAPAPPLQSEDIFDPMDSREGKILSAIRGDIDLHVATQQAAPEAPVIEQQAAKWTSDEIADACVKAGLGVLECNALIVTLKDSPAATTASASDDLLQLAIEGLRICAAQPLPHGVGASVILQGIENRISATAHQTERMQPSREADFDVDAILAAICEEAGYINLSMQSVREILAKHGAALARAPLPDQDGGNNV